MAHIGLKPSLEIKFDFDVKESLNNEQSSKENREMLKSYQESDKYAEDYDRDLMILTKNKSFITAFDYLYQRKKIMIPEVNPVTIYYSNAVMSNYMIEEYKKIFLDKTSIGVASNHSFGNFFQLAFNCIINLQASIETFLNYILDKNEYIFYDKNKKVRNGSIHEKIEIALPEIFKKTFKSDYEFHFTQIKDLISIRNGMIHLKPDKEQTNSKYKTPYRKVLDFKFDETVEAVKVFINYHQNNLIEECDCGKDFYFDIVNK
jgi:hypothetical protein